MKIARFGIALIAILAIVFVSYKELKGTTGSVTKEKLSVVTIGKGSLRQVVESTGRVEANLEVDVKSKASGQITTVMVEFSDHVKKGDLLIQLDPIDEDRSLKRAQVAMDAARAKNQQAIFLLEIARQNLKTEERKARADLLSTKAQASEAISKLKRSKELLSGKFLSQEEMDAVESLNAKSQAALEAAHTRIVELEALKIGLSCKEEDIKIAASAVSTTEIAFAEAQQRLKETRIIAPIDGVITASEAQIGLIVSSGISNVGGGSALMSIADLSRCFVEASVDESEIGKVRVGQSVEVTADAFPGKQFAGRVERVSAKGVVEQNVVTFVVKIEVTGEGVALLKPEMTSNVSIITAAADDVVVVPALAIVKRKNKSFVQFVKGDGTIEKRRIETGIGDLEKTEVISGLSLGDKVVLDDISKVSQWRTGSSDSSRDQNRANNRKERMQAQMMGSKGPGR